MPYTQQKCGPPVVPLDPTDTGEHVVPPVATSAGAGARMADKTAESVGERAGDAYADATTDEARERSRRVVRHADMQGGSQAGQFNQQTFVMVIAAFALGYFAALLIYRSRQIRGHVLQSETYTLFRNRKRSKRARSLMSSKVAQ